MSFVPIPQHGNAPAGSNVANLKGVVGPSYSNNNNNNNNDNATVTTAATSSTFNNNNDNAAAAAAADGENLTTMDILFKLRTFDLHWVEQKALMYRDGMTKSFDKESKKAYMTFKQRSSIPLILRDMAPPEGSIFDPAKKWEEEKERRRIAGTTTTGGDDTNEDGGAVAAAAVTTANTKKSSNKKGGVGGGGGGGGGADKKKSAADTIKESNAAEKLKKDHERDLQKLSNLKKLKELQDTVCETARGKVHRMIKMLHLAVCDLRQGAVGSSEAEVLDILWALEEMSSFKNADDEITAEKNAKKEAKEDDGGGGKKSSKDDKKKDKKDAKKDKKSSKKDKDKDKGGDAPKKIILTAEAVALKNLYKDGGDSRGSYKDSLKYARKLMASKSDNLISFQLLEMPDRLPPLSRYNRTFKLEDWQCSILQAIDHRRSAVVCAPTSSGKTLLSTYTCKNAGGTVLFVLPSEVLVWQVASTYYQFFKGNVTVCTDLITFQEVTGDAQVYIGTPLALERSISKVRGCAGDEMTKGEREFMILDGGFHQFNYLVLDEVHTLNGPEGDALQRLIKACNCPILALSATIGNATQLQSWFNSVTKQHYDATIIDASDEKKRPYRDVLLKEHFARFINLQRYVVTESEGKDGKVKQKLHKLHPVAAMTPERLATKHELIAGLSMTPSDLMDLWKRMRSIFPSTVLEELDNPDVFFKQFFTTTTSSGDGGDTNNSSSSVNNRVTLNQTKEYEIRLKKRLATLSVSHPELYERLRKAQLPPPLVAKTDVSEMVYGVVDQLKQNDLLPAVAFQLNTYGAFNMFKTLLRRLEKEQTMEFPNYRRDLMKVAREKAQMRKVAAGKASRENQAEAEEDAKTGFVDESLIQEDTTKPHDKYVLSAAGKRIGFNEVEDIIADMKKSGEIVDINHALIRGLRRGIAIYTNEVGFSCYRRQVQMLAQKGRLAVVFSDDALAYGVNMPFRSCIFCGDMGDALTPLIAQQMQGRAGRRGLDVQGNVVYLGMNWLYIENLMLGQISQVTGKEPRYPTMLLQYALAAANDPDDTKHFVHDNTNNNALDGGGSTAMTTTGGGGSGASGGGPSSNAFANAIRRIQKYQQCFPTVTEQQMEWMCETTLEEFCNDQLSNPNYYTTSFNVIKGLGYIHDDLSLAMDHNVLSMVWEMREFMSESIHLCGILEQLYFRFCFQKTKTYKESDAAQNEFLPVLLHVVDRTLCKKGDESLQQLLRVVSSDDGNKPINDDSRSMWIETEKTLREQRTLIDSFDIDDISKQQLQLELPPGNSGNSDGNSDDDNDELLLVGPPLDKGVYEMLVSKQKGFTVEQTMERRNELKNRIVRLGHLCRIAHNNIMQPHGKFLTLEVLFRKLFSNIKYSVGDMMRQLTDQDDVTEV